MLGTICKIGGLMLALAGLVACAPQPPAPLALPIGYTPILSTDQAPNRLIETVANRLDQGCWFGGPLPILHRQRADRGARSSHAHHLRASRPPHGRPRSWSWRVHQAARCGRARASCSSGRLPSSPLVTPWTTFIGLRPAIAPAVADILRTDIIATHYGFDRCTSLSTGIG